MQAREYELRDAWWNAENIAAFVAELRKCDVLDDVARKRVDAAHAAGGLASPFELLPFCKHAGAFDRRNYPRDPAVFIEAIHREVAGILPLPVFESLAYEVRADERGAHAGWRPRRLRVTLRTKQGTYEQDSFFGQMTDDPGPECLDAQAFYQVFNKMLADAGAPARVHRVDFDMEDYPGRAADHARFGLILLTEAQVAALRCSLFLCGDHARPFFDLSYESFASVGPARITRALARYKKLGLLDHLTKEQIAEAKARSRAQALKSLNGLLELLPGVVAVLIGKDALEGQPYAAFVRALAAISRGDFMPTEIVDDFVDNGPSPFAFQFTHAGLRFTTELTVHDGWMDPHVMDLVDRAATATNLPGRFYQLEGDGESTPIIYLTPAQHDALKDESLARFVAGGT